MVRIIEPSYVNHDGGAIYSIDAHPSGSKFITCGQKELSSSGVVMVWNMSPIESEKNYKDSNIPKILCQIFTQAGANCVRWSPDGKRFAVGSDDFSVSIWEFIGRVNSAGSVLGKGANIERYKETSTIRVHSMEVLSVEWSQNGKYLASSSMDNMIYIWNAKKLPERIAVLKEHTDSVKGVSWDPIGKYLATMSSDKTLKLWQTDSWECTTTISEPFKSSGQKTMFTRLDWSPDGKYLFVPSSTNNSAPTIQIVERQTWNIERDLVGHRKATTCVRALPRMLYAELKNGKKMQFCCVASGSRDKGISIWLLPGISRPLLVMTNIFRHTVMDIMWNGMSLTACSQDGTVISLIFDEKSLGETLTSSMMSDLCHKMYCIRPPQYEDETVIEDGNNHNLDDSVNNHEASFSSSFVTCPDDVIAKRKRDEESSKLPASSSIALNDNEKENSEAKEQEKRLIEERSKQVEEVTTSGKRRIQPIFLASTSTGETLQSAAPTKSTTKDKVTSLAKRKDVDDGEDIDDEDEDDSDEDEEEEDDDEEEEEEEEEEEMEVDENNKQGRSRKKGERKKRRRREEEEDQVTTINFKKPTLRPTEQPSMRVSEGTVVMDAPEKQPTMMHVIQDRKTLQLEIDNKWRHAGVETTCVKLVKKKGQQGGNENMWTIIIGAVVINVSANRHICLFGCGDRCLRVYLTDCGSLVTCVRLDSLPVSIGVRDYAGYVLTEYGKLSTWEFQSQKSIMSRQPIFECVETSNDTSLSSLDIGQNGIPLILLSNGSVYTYNIGLNCWIQVVTSNAISKFFEPFDESQLGDGPLGRLLRRMRRTGTGSNVAANISKCVKESQIEQLLHCAEMLGNSSDYRSIISLYVETLCDNGSEKKLRNLFFEMSKTGASIVVCGLRRAAVLEDLSNLVKTRQPSIASRILSNGQSNNKKLSLF